MQLLVLGNKQLQSILFLFQTIEGTTHPQHQSRWHLGIPPWQIVSALLRSPTRRYHQPHIPIPTRHQGDGKSINLCWMLVPRIIYKRIHHTYPCIYYIDPPNPSPIFPNPRRPSRSKILISPTQNAPPKHHAHPPRCRLPGRSQQ